MNRKIYLLKQKTGPSQIQTRDLRYPRRICYLLAKCSGDTKKFTFIMNQGTTRSPDESCEVIYPVAIPLFILRGKYRKGNKNIRLLRK